MKMRLHSTSHLKWTLFCRALLAVVVKWFPGSRELIHWEYFADIEVIVWLPQLWLHMCEWRNAEGRGWNRPATIHNKFQSGSMISLITNTSFTFVSYLFWLYLVCVCIYIYYIYMCVCVHWQYISKPIQQEYTFWYDKQCNSKMSVCTSVCDYLNVDKVIPMNWPIWTRKSFYNHNQQSPTKQYSFKMGCTA